MTVKYHSVNRLKVSEELFLFVNNELLEGTDISAKASSIRLKVFDVPKDLSTRMDFFGSKFKGEKITGYESLVSGLKRRLGEDAIYFLKEDFSYEPEDSCSRKSISSYRLSPRSNYHPERPLWLV